MTFLQLYSVYGRKRKETPIISCCFHPLTPPSLILLLPSFPLLLNSPPLLAPLHFLPLLILSLITPPTSYLSSTLLLSFPFLYHPLPHHHVSSLGLHLFSSLLLPPPLFFPRIPTRIPSPPSSLITPFFPILSLPEDATSPSASLHYQVTITIPPSQ